MRLIDADKLKNYIRTNFSKSMRQQSVLTSIDEQPVVDVNEIRHGEWRETEEPLGWEDVSTAVRLFSRGGKIKDFEREAKGWQARAFFMALYEADIPHIAVENPVPLKHFKLPAYTQKIEPCFFGDPWKKRTCLWLKGLPKLKPTQIVEPIGSWVSAGSKKANGAQRGVYTPGFRDQKKRSKTFPGIARAMAEQWGEYSRRRP